MDEVEDNRIETFTAQGFSCSFTFKNGKYRDKSNIIHCANFFVDSSGPHLQIWEKFLTDNIVDDI